MHTHAHKAEYLAFSWGQQASNYIWLRQCSKSPTAHCPYKDHYNPVPISYPRIWVHSWWPQGLWCLPIPLLTSGWMWAKEGSLQNLLCPETLFNKNTMRYGRLCLNWEISILWLAQSPDTLVRDMGPLPYPPKGVMCHRMAAPFDPVKFLSRTQRNRAAGLPAAAASFQQSPWQLLELPGDRLPHQCWRLLVTGEQSILRTETQ